MFFFISLQYFVCVAWTTLNMENEAGREGSTIVALGGCVLFIAWTTLNTENETGREGSTIRALGRVCII